MEVQILCYWKVPLNVMKEIIYIFLIIIQSSLPEVLPFSSDPNLHFFFDYISNKNDENRRSNHLISLRRKSMFNKNINSHLKF